ncbi:MAG: cell division protein FtsX [Acidobacteriota bacterium]
MKAIGYAFEEAWVSLRRSGRSAAMSVGTIAIAFVTLGGFLMASSNLRALVERWADAAEVSVYLLDTVGVDERSALVTDLERRAEVAAVEYVSREAALARFKADFPELADIAEDTNHPFPASLEVRLTPTTRSADAAETIAKELLDQPGVADVRYDRRWLTRLLAFATTLRIVGVTIAAVLVLGAAFTVAAVVRLSLLARREELDIMQLVGAPLSYLRGPFVVEGSVVGGVGALVALLALWVTFTVTRSRLVEAASGFAAVGPPDFLGVLDGALLLLSGIVVGGLSGFVASRSAGGLE